MRLMANNPNAKRVGIKGFGLEIVETVPLPVTSDPLQDLSQVPAKVGKRDKNKTEWMN